MQYEAKVGSVRGRVGRRCGEGMAAWREVGRYGGKRRARGAVRCALETVQTARRWRGSRKGMKWHNVFMIWATHQFCGRQVLPGLICAMAGSGARSGGGAGPEAFRVNQLLRFKWAVLTCVGATPRGAGGWWGCPPRPSRAGARMGAGGGAAARLVGEALYGGNNEAQQCRCATRCAAPKCGGR